MRILVTKSGAFIGDDLVIGEEYDCVLADDGSDRQNRAWHALLQEYWRSGCHSYNAKNFMHFRELIKLNLGAGVESYYNIVSVYEYRNTSGLLEKATVMKEPTIEYRIKSWSRYSKKERKESIDRLIAEMEQAQVQTKKFYEILNGMEANSLKVAV